MTTTTTQDFWSNLHKYRAIIIAVFIFMICDFAVMGTNWYSSYQISEAAVSINLSGRQRMLSQRTAKVLLSMQEDSRTSVSLDASLKELRLVADLFDTTLRGFRDGATVTGGDNNPVFLKQVETPKAVEIIRSTYIIWTPYLEKLQPLLAGNFSAEQLNETTIYARTNNLKLLGMMNDLTTDLEHLSNQRAQQLRIIQIVGLVAALLNVLYTMFKSVTDLMRGDRALAKARKETEEIMNTVKEGLFLIDKDYQIGSQYSKSLPKILGRDVQPESPLLPVLEEMVPKNIYDDSKDYIELLLGDRVKESLVTDLNPLNQVEVQEQSGKSRYLSFSFNRVLEEGKVSHLLTTVQDVTQQVHLAKQLEAAKGQARIEVEVLLKLLKSDPTVLQQFIDNVGHSLAEINEKLRTDDNTMQGRLHLLNFIMRSVHGIKGEAAALGIEMFENYAHSFEQELVMMRDRGEMRGEDMVRTTVLLDGFYEHLTSISGVIGQISSINTQHGSNASIDADVKYEQAFSENLSTLLKRIASDEKKEIKLVANLADISKLPRRMGNELQTIAIQLLRNAVKHGIETPDERESQGKSRQGEICIDCQETEPGKYEFKVRDDGRGISVIKIREALVQSGQFNVEQAATLTPRDIVLKLFEPGFTTAENVDRDAGRGVGLDVVWDKIKLLRGRMALKSRPQALTEFCVRFEV